MFRHMAVNEIHKISIAKQYNVDNKYHSHCTPSHLSYRVAGNTDPIWLMISRSSDLDYKLLSALLPLYLLYFLSKHSNLTGKHLSL